MIISGFPLIQVITAVIVAYVFVVLLGKPWPLIGTDMSRDLNTSLWLVQTDHVTWILAPDWSRLHLSACSANLPRSKDAIHRVMWGASHYWQPSGPDKVGWFKKHMSDFYFSSFYSDLSLRYRWWQKTVTFTASRRTLWEVKQQITKFTKTSNMDILIFYNFFSNKDNKNI